MNNTYYVSIAYVGECCAKPHVVLERIVASDPVQAQKKFEMRLHRYGIDAEAIRDGELVVVPHRMPGN